MSITPFGAIVILLITSTFFFKDFRDRIFLLTVILIPFFYTVALQLSFTVIKPFHLSGLFLIGIYLFDQLRLVLKDHRWFYTSYPNIIGSILIVMLLLSAFLPKFLQYETKVVPESIGYGEIFYAIPLKFTTSNLTQCFYPIFGILLFMACAHFASRSLSQIHKTIMINIRIVILLLVFTVFFHVSNLTGNQRLIENVFAFFYPEASRSLFNDVSSIGLIIRSFTFVGEPAFSAVFYLFVLSLILGVNYNGFKDNKAIKWTGSLIPLIILAIFFLASTTGYVGLPVMVAAYAFLLFIRKGSSVPYLTDRRIFNSALILGFFVTIILLITFQMADMDLITYLIEEHFSKIEGEGSGATRIETMTYALENVFVKSPWFGVGFGSHRTASLFATLLTNIGIVGTSVFLVFNFVIARRCWLAMVYTTNPKLASISFAILLCYLTLIPILVFVQSMITILFGWYWLLLGLLESSYIIYLKESDNKAQEQD